MSRRSLLRDCFSFSWSEKLGILGLCGMILIMLVVKISLPHLVGHGVQDTGVHEEEIASFRQAVGAMQASGGSMEAAAGVQAAEDLFYFDPNRATDGDWKKLGLNERQVRNIRNYQAKGRHFRKKDDLQKMRTISITQYKRLEPYIRFAESEPTPEKRTGKQTETASDAPPKMERAEIKRIHVELNTADSSMLTLLYGIGPVLAARIIKYRNRIGGFTEVGQLGEVYGIKTELVEQLAAQLSADTSQIRKIPVNTATFRALISHPYITEQQTKGILNYRKLQGRINGLNELVRNHILTQEDAGRIAPYVTFD